MGGRGPYTQNQCNRSSYQTVRQSERREGDRKAFTHLCPPHLFISPSVLSLVLMSCLAIVSPGLFKSNSPLRKSGGLQGPALIACRHSRQSRIPRANHIDAPIRPSLSSFCSAKHNLWLQDKNIQKARRLNNYKGRHVKVFLLSLVVAFWTENFMRTLDRTCLKGELLVVERVCA